MPGTFALVNWVDIWVTGGAQESPADLASAYAWDRATPRNMVERTGITGTDAAPVARNPYSPLMPLEYGVLGGSGLLELVVSNWNATSVTVRIAGKDYFGNNQTEDMVVTGNGTYPTTKLFLTIDTTQVTAFNGTSFDYVCRQGFMGYVTKFNINRGAAAYCELPCYGLAIDFVIGDSITPTWFTIKSEQLYMARTTLIILPNATLQLGEELIAGSRTHGSVLVLHGTDLAKNIENSGSFIAYDSRVMATGPVRGKYNHNVANSVFALRHSVVDGFDEMSFTNINMANVTLDQARINGIRRFTVRPATGAAPPSWNKVEIGNYAESGVYTYQLSGSSPIKLQNTIIRDDGNINRDIQAQYHAGAGQPLVVVNRQLDWLSCYAGSVAKGMHRKVLTTFHVTDENDSRNTDGHPGGNLCFVLAKRPCKALNRYNCISGPKWPDSLHKKGHNDTGSGSSVNHR